jgi:hypothetical protein
MDADEELEQLIREQARDDRNGRYQPRQHGVVASINGREDDDRDPEEVIDFARKHLRGCPIHGFRDIRVRERESESAWICRPCWAEYMRTYRALNRDRINAQRRARRKNGSIGGSRFQGATDEALGKANLSSLEHAALRSPRKGPGRSSASRAFLCG